MKVRLSVTISSFIAALIAGCVAPQGPQPGYTGAGTVPSRKTPQANAEESARQRVVRAVTDLQMTITTNQQERFGGLQMSVGNLNTPSVGLQPRPGNALVLPQGHVYLVVDFDVGPLPGVTAKGGTDFYLRCSDGTKQTGYNWLLTGWTPAEAGTTTFDQKYHRRYMYVMPNEQVTSSVFHFLGADFNVGEYLGKHQQQKN